MIRNEPTEFRWRRPDGTILQTVHVAPGSGFELSVEAQRQMTVEPQVIVEWRIIGEPTWSLYGLIEHGQGGAAWWKRVGA